MFSSFRQHCKLYTILMLCGSSTALADTSSDEKITKEMLGFKVELSQKDLKQLERGSFDPQGYVLPKGVIMPEFGYFNLHATQTTDSAGNKSDLTGGTELLRKHNRFRVTYGLSDHWSMKVTLNHYGDNRIGIDNDRMLGSDAYTAGVSQVKSQFAAVMLGAGACASTEECLTAIEGGASLSSNVDSLGYTAGTPIAAFAEAAVATNINNNTGEGETGIADTFLEFGYRLPKLTQSLQHKAGIIMTLPTGKYQNLGLDKKVGSGGRSALGVGYGFDQEVTPGIWLTGFVSQSLELTKASSDLVSDVHYTALQGNYGLILSLGGYAISPMLKSIGLMARYAIQTTSEESYKIKATGIEIRNPATRLDTITYTLAYSPLRDWWLPLIIKLEAVRSVSGKNTTLVNADGYNIGLVAPL